MLGTLTQTGLEPDVQLHQGPVQRGEPSPPHSSGHASIDVADS